MKIKKISILISLSIAATSFALGVAGCTHKHSYTQEVIEPTCTTEGYTLHTCECGETFKDQIIKPKHTLVFIPNVESSCTAGNMAYYICSDCKKWFSDMDGKNEITDKNSVITTKAHTLTLIPAAKPTCTEDGNIKYYVCNDCKTWFSDKNGNEVIPDKYKYTVIVPKTHTLTLVPAVEPTCTKEGNTAYYVCDDCQTWFSDKNGKNEITDKNSVIIAKSEHLYVDGVCKYCNDRLPTPGIIYDYVDDSHTALKVTSMGNLYTPDIVIADEVDGVPVTEIADYAFKDATITSIKIGNNVTKISTTAFENCPNLHKVVIPKSVISYRAFEGCLLDEVHYTGTLIEWCNHNATGINRYGYSAPAEYKLFIDGTEIKDELTIPEGVPVIGGYTFCNITALKTLNVGNGTKVGSSSFQNCANLETINLDAGVTAIGAMAFINCTNLKVINYGGTISQWEALLKDSNWDNNTGEYTVVCTDGMVKKAQA